MGKQKEIYQIEVKGESESDWSSASPEAIEPLIFSQNNKNVAGLKFEVVKKQVEMYTNKGETEKATEAIQLYLNAERAGYQAPVSRFKRDLQNGHCPFIGAHCFFGAFRDAADYMYPEYFYQKGVKGMAKNPSKKHLRKVVRIKPNHVFLYRDGKKIDEPDNEEGQQPVGEVKGFAYYEIIQHPFEFGFKIQVNPSTKMFSDLLGDFEKMEKVIIQSAWHGIGSRRSANHGMWEIKSIKFIA